MNIYYTYTICIYILYIMLASLGQWVWFSLTCAIIIAKPYKLKTNQNIKCLLMYFIFLHLYILLLNKNIEAGNLQNQPKHSPHKNVLFSYKNIVENILPHMFLHVLVLTKLVL